MSYDIRPKLICTQNLLVQATITGFNYLNPVAIRNIGWKYYSKLYSPAASPSTPIFATMNAISPGTLRHC
jgi:hypothetical protein